MLIHLRHSEHQKPNKNEDSKGKVLQRVERASFLEALGSAAYDVPLTVPPDLKGQCTLKAMDKAFGAATLSRRWITVSSLQR